MLFRKNHTAVAFHARMSIYKLQKDCLAPPYRQYFLGESRNPFLSLTEVETALTPSLDSPFFIQIRPPLKATIQL